VARRRLHGAHAQHEARGAAGGAARGLDGRVGGAQRVAAEHEERLARRA
jgi:hypothetical protein